MTKLIRNFPRTKNFRVMISIELIVLDYCATVFIENNLIRNDESRWNHSDLKFHNLKTQFIFRNTKYFLSTCKNLVFRGLNSTSASRAFVPTHKINKTPVILIGYTLTRYLGASNARARAESSETNPSVKNRAYASKVIIYTAWDIYMCIYSFSNRLRLCLFWKTSTASAKSITSKTDKNIEEIVHVHSRRISGAQCFVLTRPLSYECLLVSSLSPFSSPLLPSLTLSPPLTTSLFIFPLSFSVQLYKCS